MKTFTNVAAIILVVAIVILAVSAIAWATVKLWSAIL